MSRPKVSRVMLALHVGSSQECHSTPPAGIEGEPVVAGTARASLIRGRPAYSRSMSAIDVRAEIRDFLSTRRARLTPEQAGLPAYGTNRRVTGLRREEVAMLAGVSVDYYVRMERGSLAGASESVLDALSTALQLDEAERAHLYALARESGPAGARRKRPAPAGVRPEGAVLSSSAASGEM